MPRGEDTSPFHLKLESHPEHKPRSMGRKEAENHKLAMGMEVGWRKKVNIHFVLLLSFIKFAPDLWDSAVPPSPLPWDVR